MTDNLLLMKLESKAKKDKDRHIKGVGRAHYTQVPRGPVYSETEKKQNRRMAVQHVMDPIETAHGKEEEA